MELELFLHILGAMVLVGGLVLAAAALAGRGRTGLRLAFLALVAAALPGWIVMRVAAQLLAGDIPSGFEPSWIEIGYMVAEPGLLLLLGATLAVGLARRGTAGAGAETAAPLSARIATGLIALSLVAYLVVIWAMTTKPV